jgi:hypothetical protein
MFGRVHLGASGVDEWIKIARPNEVYCNKLLNKINVTCYRGGSPDALSSIIDIFDSSSRYYLEFHEAPILSQDPVNSYHRMPVSKCGERTSWDLGARLVSTFNHSRVTSPTISSE